MGLSNKNDDLNGSAVDEKACSGTEWNDKESGGDTLDVA